MDKVVVLLDEYNKIDEFLLETVRYLAPQCQCLVCKDMAFLPEGIVSVFDYFIDRYETEVLPEKDLFYVFLDIPEFWEIRVEGMNGAIYDNGKKKATIYFREPEETRMTQRVEWNTESGRVYKIDYYNKRGYIYCRAFFDSAENLISKAYFTSENKEVLHVNYTNGTVIVFEDGKTTKIYASMDEFITAAIQKVLEENSSLIITSGKQVKMLQDSFDLNQTEYQIMVRSRTEADYFQRELWHRKTERCLNVLSNSETALCQVDNSKREYMISYIAGNYPEVKGNPDILIYTSSDMLFGIEELAEDMPEVTFHIAANTLVSSKLSNMSARQNVYVYPAIAEEDLQRLLNRCDFYLDINYEAEVNDVIIRASRNNLLLLGFRNSLHNSHYVLEECIFEDGEEKELSRKILALIGDKAELVRLTNEQQEKAKRSIVHMMR